MAFMNMFKTTTSEEFPLDGSGGNEKKAAVSDFVSVQSFSNFAMMTGAISAAWQVYLQRLSPLFSTLWVPVVFAAIWGGISVVVSLEGLKETVGDGKKGTAGNHSSSSLFGLNQLVDTGKCRGGSQSVYELAPLGAGSYADYRARDYSCLVTTCALVSIRLSCARLRRRCRLLLYRTRFFGHLAA